MDSTAEHENEKRVPGSREPDLDNIPEELTSRDQWVVSGRDKIPRDPRHPSRNAKVNDPATHGTFDDAVKALGKSGVKYPCFVFREDDTVAGVDFDKCLDPETGVVDPAVQEEIERLDTYTEVSPSGTGLHSFAHLTQPLPGGGRKAGGIEVYEKGRHFVTTGWHLEGTPQTVNERTDGVLDLYERLRPKDRPGQGSGSGEPGPGHHAYAQAALRGEVEAVRDASEGERNHQLNRSAFALGQCAHLGLDRDEVSAKLTEAAVKAGLDKREIEATFRSGWEAGLREPRMVPPVDPVPQQPKRVLADLPTYPVAALPEPVRSYVKAAAESIGCPPEMVSVPMLAYAGAVIGNRFFIRLKDGFDQWPVFWVAVVAPPGTAKTPANDAARVPLEVLQKEAAERYELEMEKYKQQLAEYELAHKKEKKR